MESEVVVAAKELKSVIECAMDPNTDHQRRLDAYKTCEDFKESSPLCSACGVLLAEKENNHMFRHFGLHLIEHCVKNRWNAMPGQEKLFIKNSTMALMKSGTFDILTEQPHIKDALSRITVEMIKREWPQQWPKLMQELQELCDMGPTQAELVYLIFLRLTEDVVTFQNVSNTRRRRELLQSLVSNMDSIYPYSLMMLKSNFETYQQLKNASNPTRTGEVEARVCCAVLRTLTGMVEILSTALIMMEDGLLLQMLCIMLGDAALQLQAAECLLLLASRKGKAEDRRCLLVLFHDDAMSAILKATQEASQAVLNEHHYVFLKRLCQVLVAIGNQLSFLWGSCDDVEQPSSFTVYLQAILQFTLHPSQVLANYTNPLWTSYLRHAHISTNTAFLELLPQVINTTRTTLFKVGFPSHNDSQSCCYARQDFESDADFHLFFSKYRRDVGEIVRCATTVSPSLMFQCASIWLKEQICKPISNNGDHCNLSSMAYLEWDALSVFLECVMSRLHTTEYKPQTEGVDLLKAVVSYESQDPLILSCVLSCLSSLVVFINDAHHIMSSVIKKILDSAVFDIEGQTKATRSKAVKNVRRHASAVLVKMCKQYTQLLLPSFDQLCSHICGMSSKLSQLEETTLMEALIILSNQFKDFDKQSHFIGEVLEPFRKIWFDLPLQESLWNVEKFMTYVGLDQAPVEPSSKDTCGINRSKMMYCVNTILAVLKRTAWPSDPDEARAGGFGIPGVPGSFRSPSQPHLMEMLDNVLGLTRTMNALWMPVHLESRHPEFKAAYDLLEVDKQRFLGNLPPCVDNSNSSQCKQPLERMQSFLSSVHENCYHILGNAGTFLGHDFYGLPALTTSLLNSAFTNLHLVPDYRVKPVLRSFWKPYILSCPTEYYEKDVIPVLMAICPHMLQRLSSKWTIINQKKDASDGDDEEAQEIVEEQIIRTLSREYLDFLISVLKEKGGKETTEDGNRDDAMEDDGDVQQRASQSSSGDDKLSDLGVLALQTEGLFPSIVMAILQGLTWNDTQTCFKSVSIFSPVLQQMLAVGRMTGDDACHLFSMILQGLHVHGQHEGNQSMLITLALHSFEQLRPAYPEVRTVMLQVPNCVEKNLTAFEEKLFPQSSQPQRQMPEKFKKDAFKRLIQEIIGQNISQLFRSDSRIKDLPPMFKCPKPERPSMIDATCEGDVGLCSLFSQPQ